MIEEVCNKTCSVELQYEKSYILETCICIRQIHNSLLGLSHVETVMIMTCVIDAKIVQQKKSSTTQIGL